MSIKVTIGESETQKGRGFPKLMIANANGGSDEGMIVLFCSESNGIVLSRPLECGKEVGYVSSSFYMQCFDDYNEPITLQND